MLDLVKLIVEELEDARESGVYDITFRIPLTAEEPISVSVQMEIENFVDYMSKYEGTLEVMKYAGAYHCYYKCDGATLVCVTHENEMAGTVLERYV